jgi:hypothetical protein
MIQTRDKICESWAWLMWIRPGIISFKDWAELHDADRLTICEMFQKCARIEIDPPPVQEMKVAVRG